MATLNELISDIELRLTKGNISDDFNIDKRQINHWIKIVRSGLIKQEVMQNGTLGIEGYITFFPCRDIDEEDTDCQCKDPFRYVVKLPSTIIALPGDIGVYRVELQSGEPINRIRITDQSRFKNLKFRGGDENGKVNLYLVVENTSILDPNEEFPLDTSTLPTLLDMVEQIGRRELQLPEDVSNDGVQDNMTNGV